MKNLKDKINCDCKGIMQCTMYALVLWMGVPYVAVMLSILYGMVKAALLQFVIARRHDEAI